MVSPLFTPTEHPSQPLPRGVKALEDIIAEMGGGVYLSYTTKYLARILVYKRPEVTTNKNLTA